MGSTDIEQRNGRIIRQGNTFSEIGVYNYVTENTFDAYLMNIIVTKQRNHILKEFSVKDFNELLVKITKLQQKTEKRPLNRKHDRH